MSNVDHIPTLEGAQTGQQFGEYLYFFLAAPDAAETGTLLDHVGWEESFATIDVRVGVGIVWRLACVTSI